MVVVDMSVNNNDIVKLITTDKAIRHILFSTLKIFEEVFKLVAEALFIGAFYSCLKNSKRSIMTNE